MDSSFSVTLARCDIHYAALRGAFLTTLDCLLRDSLGHSSRHADSSGFLDRIPLLAATAPQVQLECLLRTWQRLCEGQPQFPALIDQCVLHAALELLLQVVREDNQRLLRMIWNGPRQLETAADAWLHSKICSVQLLTAPGSVLSLPCQPPTTAGDQLLQKISRNVQLVTARQEQPADELFEILGQWRISREVLANLDDLLTQAEQGVLEVFFEEHPSLFAQ